MGGLAFASIMAKLRKWRVLVLERHFKIGGFTHTFTRPGGWSWDVGLHYVGDMGEGMMGRRLFDLITEGRVTWSSLPDVYDVFVYPNLRVGACKGEANFRTALTAAFPNEKSNIEQYFRDLRTTSSWASRYLVAMAMPPLLARITGDLPLEVTQRYLERRFRDPQLRAEVTSQWADYGMPPGRSAFATDAVIANHYLKGAWYPDGGAGEIANATGAVNPCAAGGELLPNHEVTRILLEGGRAVGVEVNVRRGKQGTRAEFRAPVVVSDAGAWNTFTRLVPASALPFREQLKSPPEGFEVVELFLGLRRDPREMVSRGRITGFLSRSTTTRCMRSGTKFSTVTWRWYISRFPSLRDRHAQRHTAEIIAPLSDGSLEAHRDEPWRRRGADYESAKNRITRALLDLVERHHPGFGDLVEYSELATPLTLEHFSSATSGAIYGYPATPEKYGKTWLGPRTPIQNLYLRGVHGTACFLGMAI